MTDICHAQKFLLDLYPSLSNTGMTVLRRNDSDRNQTTGLANTLVPVATLTVMNTDEAQSKDDTMCSGGCKLLASEVQNASYKTSSKFTCKHTL